MLSRIPISSVAVIGRRRLVSQVVFIDITLIKTTYMGLLVTFCFPCMQITVRAENTVRLAVCPVCSPSVASLSSNNILTLSGRLSSSILVLPSSWNAGKTGPIKMPTSPWQALVIKQAANTNSIFFRACTVRVALADRLLPAKTCLIVLSWRRLSSNWRMQSSSGRWAEF